MVQNNSVAEVKTEKSSANSTETVPAKSGSLFNSDDKYQAANERNILHNYRSWTYNFTIGALTAEALADNTLLARDIKNYTVLNSAGKGTGGISVNASASRAPNYQDTKKLVEGYNQNSPGRFDMYIDNVSVDSFISAGNKQGGSSVATNISFDVYEPYSMNGFIEAMQVAARAAGYSDYMKACFALRVQFQGYPDTATNAQMKPEIIPMSTRYFCITITEIGVDVNESGTRYRVNSVPIPQMALGTPNKLTSDIKVAGNTVGEVLKNFFDAINQMVEDRTKSENKQPGRDIYEISCPKLSTVGKPQNTKLAVLSESSSTTYTSNIIDAKMNDELKSVNVFKMGDLKDAPNASVPGAADDKSKPAANPSTGKLNPKTGTVVFSADAQIHDCIAAIVRDSEYVKNILKPEKLEEVKKGSGEIQYFTVRMETEIIGDDQVNNKKFYKYRYVLEPFMMHYTRIPGQQLGEIELKDIKGKIKREYDYIYTGKNVDIVKFALRFDNLYFNAIPAAMGNRPADDPKSKAAGPGGIVNSKQEKSEAVAEQSKKPADSVPTASTKTDPSANTMRSEAKGGQVQGDPYALMAQTLHDSVLNSVDMIQGTLEILGDPYYLVTGGMGNADLNLKEPMLTVDGEAPITQGDVYININFRNPIDINPKTGLADFGVAPISFSGVYRVIQLKNTFKDGVFTQGLEIVRIPGQIIGKGKEILPPSGSTTPQPGQQLIKDTALASILRSGIRPGDFSLANLLGRGLPNPGLPGNLSNFTNSLLGPNSAIGSATAAAGGILNQVNGLANQANNLTNQLGVSPIEGVNQLTSGVRLAASGLGALGQATDLTAAAVTAAGKAVSNIGNIPDAAVKLASNTFDSIKALPASAVAAANGVITNVTSQVDSLVESSRVLASNASASVTGLVGGIKDKVTDLQKAVPTDFASIGAKLGISPSALSGLDPKIASKVGEQLVEAAKKVPENASLPALAEQGVSFAAITGDKLVNLPAVQPKVAAPFAITDPGIAQIAKQFGDIASLQSGNITLPPITDLNKVTNMMGTVSAAGNGLLKTAESAMGTIANANSLVNSAIGSTMGVVNNVGSLAQNTLGKFNPASLGLGSVESNLKTVAGLAQNSTKAVNDLGIAVTSQFGSLQQSPLAKLVRDNNIEGSV